MQCEAKAKSTGHQCQRSAIAGLNVCRVHGGNTKLARAAGARRMEEAKSAMLNGLPEIAAELTRIALSAESESVRVQATREVFARLGFGEADKVEISLAAAESRVDAEIARLSQVHDDIHS